jgi:hypothetical protein
MVICACLLVAGAVLSALFVDNNVLKETPGETARGGPECHTYCPVGAPPLEASQPAEPSQGPRTGQRPGAG